MKAGTVIKLPNGKTGTVCYHGLDGYGIVWGEQLLDENDWPMYDAMLRIPWETGQDNYVGEEYEIIKIPTTCPHCQKIIELNEPNNGH